MPTRAFSVLLGRPFLRGIFRNIVHLLLALHCHQIPSTCRHFRYSVFLSLSHKLHTYVFRSFLVLLGPISFSPLIFTACADFVFCKTRIVMFLGKGRTKNSFAPLALHYSPLFLVAHNQASSIEAFIASLILFL